MNIFKRLFKGLKRRSPLSREEFLTLNILSYDIVQQISYYMHCRQYDDDDKSTSNRAYESLELAQTKFESYVDALICKYPEVNRLVERNLTLNTNGKPHLIKQKYNAYVEELGNLNGNAKIHNNA